MLKFNDITMISESSRTLACAAYITPVGWMVALAVRHVTDDFTPFTTFHLRQALGLSIIEILCWAILYHALDAWVAWNLTNIPLLIMIILGLRGANSGLMRYQPFVGRFFDKTFTFINDRL